MNHSASFVTTHFGRPCIIDETQLIESRKSQKLFSETVLVAAAVPLRGHVEPAARIPPMHSAWSKKGAAAWTAAVPR